MEWVGVVAICVVVNVVMEAYRNRRAQEEVGEYDKEVQ